MQCNNCGQELVPGGQFCGNCGSKLITPMAPQAQPVQNFQANVPPPNQPVADSQFVAPPPTPVPTLAPAMQSTHSPFPSAPQTTWPNPTQQINNAAPPSQAAYAVPIQPSSGMSIASMVLGIISILTSLLWFLSIPLAIMAIIFGVLGMKKGGKGLAVTGIITGGIGILASIVILILAFSYVENNPEEFPELSSSVLNIIRFD